MPSAIVLPIRLVEVTEELCLSIIVITAVGILLVRRQNANNGRYSNK